MGPQVKHTQLILFENVFPARGNREKRGRKPRERSSPPQDGFSLCGKEYPLSTNHRAALETVFDAYRLRLNGFRLSSSYYRYTSLTHTIRTRGRTLLLRVSHHYKDQPDRAIEAIGHILFRKLLGMRPLKRELAVCREVDLSLEERIEAENKNAKSVSRLRRHFFEPQGTVYDLNELADSVADRFFNGDFEKIPIYWSKKRAKRYWGKYYPQPPRIIINRRLDHPKVPRRVVEAVLYHEMLHHDLGIPVIDGRRRAHTPEFRHAERQFPQLDEVEKFLERIS